MAPGSAFPGFVAQDLAELGFDMARIAPDASVTDHDPLARHGRLHRPSRGLTVTAPAAGFGLQVSRDEGVHERSPGWYERADHFFNLLFD